MRVKSSKGVFVSVCDGCGRQDANLDPPWRFIDAPYPPYLHPLKGKVACSDRCETVVRAKFAKGAA